MIPYICNRYRIGHENNIKYGYLTDCISCVVKETINGDFVLTLEYKKDGQYSEYLINDNIIGALVPYCYSEIGITSEEKVKVASFRIDTVKETEKKITVSANHISYDLLNYYYIGGKWYDYTEDELVQYYGFMHPYDFVNNYNAGIYMLVFPRYNDWIFHNVDWGQYESTNISFIIPANMNMRKFLLGSNGKHCINFADEGAKWVTSDQMSEYVGDSGDPYMNATMIDAFACDGMEFKFDENDIYMMHRRGRASSGIKVVYGRDLKGYTQTKTNSDMVTGIILRIKDTDVTLYDAYFGFEYHDPNYEKPRYAILDMPDTYPYNDLTPEKMQEIYNTYKNLNTTVSIDVKGVVDREVLSNLNNAFIGDTVQCIFESSQASARITEYAYDVLAETYSSIKIGSTEQTLSGVVAKLADKANLRR